MAFTRITTADTTGKGVVGLPDTPGLDTTEMQNRFDELALDVIIPKLNNLISELEAVAGAASLGAKVPKGITAQQNVQSILEQIVLVAADASGKANSAFNTATDAAGKINSVAEAVNSIAYMVNPFTGQVEPINQIIESLYNNMKPAALTAAAYAALQLTADQYASYQITAYDYANYRANILGK